MEGRMPPHNLNAEKSVLGAMMLEPGASALCSRLSPQDFYYPANAQIFSAILELFSSNKPVDFMTLHDVLDKRGVLEGIGGLDYLLELNNFVPSTVNAAHYVDMVLERSLLRQLIRMAGKVSDDCYEASKDATEILRETERAVFALSQREQSSKDFVPMARAVREAYDLAEKLMENPESDTGLPTGFASLDAKLKLQPSQLILIAARPSMGKSALAMNIAQHLATYRQKKVVVFSLEMPYDQLAQRVLSTGSKVPLSKIRTGEVETGEWVKLADAVLEIEKTTILVDDTPGITILEMLSKLRRVKIEHGLDLVVIDYLQLISSPSDGRQRENRQQEISEMTRQLKLMARELDIPVVLLSQLSRAAEKRESHRPVLADLRESGAIEQDADIVLFIYRESYYKKYEGGTEAEIIIAKNRNGATGTANVAWNDSIVSFQNLDTYHTGSGT